MLVIEDDGVGIPENANSNRLSHGISGMRQRVRALHGEFSIRRRREGGTLIEVHVPLVATTAGPPAGPTARNVLPAGPERFTAPLVAKDGAVDRL